MKNPCRLLICLAFSLLLAACSSKNAADGETYTVKRGDTLSKISRMTGTSVK